MATNLFLLPIKAWGEGHEMEIIARGGKKEKEEEEWKKEGKKGNKKKWKIFARLSRGKKERAIVATLALGSRRRNRGCKVVGQEEAREPKQRGCKGADQKGARESHYILPGM
jgi:hypothetical protein